MHFVASECAQLHVLTGTPGGKHGIHATRPRPQAIYGDNRIAGGKTGLLGRPCLQHMRDNDFFSIDAASNAQGRERLPDDLFRLRKAALVIRPPRGTQLHFNTLRCQQTYER